MDIKKNTKNINVWTRGLFILIYGIIFYFVICLVWLIVAFQFFMKLITAELNTPLLDFIGSLTKYVSQILHYITFKSEERPFPFNSWPEADNTPSVSSDSKTSKKETTKKKTTKKKTTKKKTTKKKTTKKKTTKKKITE